MPQPAAERGWELRSLVTAGGMVELSLTEAPVASPGADEVLIQVEAAPINPSDLGLLLAGGEVDRAEAGGTPERPRLVLPLSPGAVRAAAARVGRSLPVGNEGAGTVVAAGSAPAARQLLGRRVAVAGGAMYAQYRVAAAGACLVLPDDASAAEGAASYVNPMTALGMVETMRTEGHTALVHTAAASNLGRMLVRLCRQEGIPLVNVVRSAVQAQLLRDAGAEHVCDSSADSFDADLRAALAASGATLVFDAIGGGSLVSRILGAMEAVLAADQPFSRYGSATHKQAYLYGGLDRGPTTLVRTFGMAWGIGGWLLPHFLARVGPQKAAELRARVARDLRGTFASQFTEQVSLAGVLRPEALHAYAQQATGRKYLVVPTLDPVP
jgi:NADPH:quinone reductase-like Zn-dependent oxidoreductase